MLLLGITDKEGSPKMFHQEKLFCNHGSWFFIVYSAKIE